jgi:hypothetical protein
VAGGDPPHHALDEERGLDERVDEGEVFGHVGSLTT